MGFFDYDDSSERAAYEQFSQPHHRGKLSHELLAGGGAFLAMQAYQNHEEAEGKPENFELGKDLIAGFAGAGVDKLIETKGMDEYDRHKAKHHAQEQAQYALANSGRFGQQQYTQRPYGGPQGYGGGPGGGYGGGPGGGYGGPGGGYSGGYGGGGGPGGYGGGGYGGGGYGGGSGPGYGGGGGGYGGGGPGWGGGGQEYGGGEPGYGGNYQGGNGNYGGGGFGGGGGW